MGADIEEIVDKKNRKGIIGWLSAARDSRAGNLTEIKKPQREPSLYDLVVIGTPVRHHLHADKDLHHSIQRELPGLCLILHSLPSQGQ